MAKKVRNQSGVISEITDDYPAEFLLQLGLEEVREGDESAKEAGSDADKRRVKR